MESFPIKIRLSRRMIALCVMFTLFALLIGYGIFKMSSQTIYMGDGTPMPLYFKAIFIALEVIIEIGALFMIVPMWKRIFARNGAMTLTEAGIENTFMLFTVFAFWTTLPIRFIPWTALQVNKLDANSYTVDIEQLPKGSVGKLAKMRLKITGFEFRIGQIEAENFEHYRQIALSQSEDTTV
ncbi:MAG: hypothetical protein J1F23_07700 [Oscillospiraceae bacterium]|nr:hypothetical protein [Oscillospiraceae bacterium]